MDKNAQFADLPDSLTPKLLIFFSADVVGSTALKQRDRDRSDLDWPTIFREFYKEAVTNFGAFWDTTSDKIEALTAGDKVAEKQLGPEPVFWKTVGDEIIFYKVLTGSEQIHACIECWIDTLDALRRKFDSSRHIIDAAGADPLDIKSSVWTAEFPRRNKEIPLPCLPGSMVRSPVTINDQGVQPTDFVGPGIDIGFRISSMATSQKMVLSLDVAYLLSITTPDHRIGRDPRPIYYDGRFYFKGVFEGTRYPIFWIDISRNQSLDKDELEILPHSDKTKIIKTCKTFYDEHYKHFIHTPFIWNDLSDKTDMPEKYKVWLLDALTAYRQALAVSDQSRAMAESPLPEDIGSAGPRRGVVNSAIELMIDLNKPTINAGNEGSTAELD